MFCQVVRKNKVQKYIQGHTGLHLWEIKDISDYSDTKQVEFILQGTFLTSTTRTTFLQEQNEPHTNERQC